MGSTLFRVLIAVVVGVLMVVYPEEAVKGITILFGVLFFVSGFVSIVWYYVMRRRYNREMLAAAAVEEEGETARSNKAKEGAESRQIEKPSVPIAGVGCALLGIILATMPETVVKVLVYVFAAIIILGAISEFVGLISAHIAINDYRKRTGANIAVSTAYGFYIIPALLLIFGIVAIAYPTLIAEAPYVCLGVAFIVYGLSEVISLIKTSSVRRTVSRASESLIPTDGQESETESAVIEAEIVSAEESGNA